METKQRNLDVVITASSRPKLLKYTINYFLKFCYLWGNNFRFLINEDFVIPKESEKTIRWLNEKWEWKNKVIFFHKKPLGLEQSLLLLMKEVKTPFFFYLQDDWVFERPVELDRILWIMENKPKMNLVFFNKHHNMAIYRKNIKQPEESFQGLDPHAKFCLFHSWSFLPGIWRTDFSLNKYEKALKTSKRETAPAKMTETIRSWEEMDRAMHSGNFSLFRDKVGSYIWGGHGERRFVRHIGEDHRMESWRLVNGKPGSEGVDQYKNWKTFGARWIPFDYIPPKK